MPHRHHFESRVRSEPLNSRVLATSRFFFENLSDRSATWLVGQGILDNQVTAKIEQVFFVFIHVRWL